MWVIWIYILFCYGYKWVNFKSPSTDPMPVPTVRGSTYRIIVTHCHYPVWRCWLWPINEWHAPTARASLLTAKWQHSFSMRSWHKWRKNFSRCQRWLRLWNYLPGQFAVSYETELSIEQGPVAQMLFVLHHWLAWTKNTITQPVGCYSYVKLSVCCENGLKTLWHLQYLCCSLYWKFRIE